VLQLITLALAAFAAPIFSYCTEEDRVDVIASNYYGPDYEPRQAIDGLSGTEWLLPDGTLGYIDLVLNRRRRIDGVEIINGHNMQFMDRAIRKARVIVFDGSHELERHDIELPGIEPDLTPRRVELGGHRANRVRLEITEVAGNGAALAEIRILD